MSHRKLWQGLGLGVGIALVGIVCWRLGSQTALHKFLADTASIRETESGYRYIRPLLACDVLRDFASPSYAPLRVDLESYIRNQQTAGDVQDVSVYYRHLAEGQWMAVDGDSQFHGASLLKVPNIMAIFRQEDQGEKILTQTYTIDPKVIPNVPQVIPPEHILQDGVTYTVDDLIRYMIVYSDNRANHVLDQVGDSDVLTKVYSDFGITLQSDAGDYTISPRDYALFFRGLYNATYLSRALSEKALAYLVQSDFTEGLVAGVPAGTVVAHKFGNDTRNDASGQVVQELHDCGLVYTPQGDYVLCVMTRGNDLHKLQSAISEISKIVYTAATASE